MKNVTKLLTLLLFALLYSCAPSNEPPPPEPPPVSEETAALYILCEGLWGTNGSTLAYYSFENQTIDKDYFNTVNGRKLGDIGNDIKIYGSKIYIAVTSSSQVEVIDARTGLSLKQLPLANENNKPREPRYIAFDGGKAYVSCFDGSVIRIDTLSLNIDATATAGRYPEGICAANGKLYIANSGGLDYPNYDNTVSVIDIASFKEIKKIEVGINPYKVEADSKGNVYVSTRGNYDDEKYRLQRIDSRTDKVTKNFDVEVLNFCIAGNYAYLYNYDYSDKSNWLKVLNLKTETIERENFITDNTQIETPYSIAVNAATKEVYITDAFDYMVTGNVLCFGEDGKLKYTLEDVGLIPNQVIYINKIED